MESTLPSLLFLKDKFSEKQIKNWITIPDSPSNPRKNDQSTFSKNLLLTYHPVLHEKMVLSSRVFFPKVSSNSSIADETYLLSQRETHIAYPCNDDVHFIMAPSRFVYGQIGGPYEANEVHVGSTPCFNVIPMPRVMLCFAIQFLI